MKVEVINRIQFNVDAIKKMSLSGFKELYEERLGEGTEKVYYKLTGKTRKKKDN